MSEVQIWGGQKQNQNKLFTIVKFATSANPNFISVYENMSACYTKLA